MIYLQDRAIYLQPWGVAYEAFALASYFMLVNVFISPDRYSEADFFKSLKLKNGKVAGARWFTVRVISHSHTDNTDVSV